MHRLIAVTFLGLLLCSACPAFAQDASRCPFSEAPPPDEALIGYIGNSRETSSSGARISVGTFRPLGIIRNGMLTETAGGFIRDGMAFWEALDPSGTPTALQRVASFLDRMGEDHCVYHGELAGDHARWTLFSSRPLTGVFFRPSDSDRAWLAEHRDVCIYQGDYRDPQPPCVRPELLAVSDIDGDGISEYWATEPYLWDTGITIWQRTDDGLSQMLTVCNGCSD